MILLLVIDHYLYNGDYFHDDIQAYTCLLHPRFLPALSLRSAQQPYTGKRKPDSVKKLDFVARMQAFAKREVQESINDFNADKATLDPKKALGRNHENTQKQRFFSSMA